MVDQAKNVLDAFARGREMKRDKEFEGYLSRYAQGDKTAVQGLLGTGERGINALGALQGLEQNKMALQQANQQNALQRFQQNAMFALAADDAELDAATPFLARMAQAAGVEAGIIDSIAKMPVPTRRGVLKNALGLREVAQDGDYIRFEATDPETGTPIMARMSGKTGQVEVIEGVAPKASKSSLKTYQDKETGDTFTVDENDPAMVQKILDNPQKFVRAPTRQETGAPGDFNMTKKQAEQLVEAEISAKTAISTANDVLARIEENPDVLQTASGLAAGVSGLVSEAKTLARVAGIDIPDAVTNLDAYEDTFAELGIEDRVARGVIFDLALAYAAASGLGKGKALSNPDVKMALRRVGEGGLTSPVARKAVIENVRDTLSRNFKIRYKTLTGKDYEGDLGGVEVTQDIEDWSSFGGQYVQPKGVVAEVNGETLISLGGGKWRKQ